MSILEILRSQLQSDTEKVAALILALSEEKTVNLSNSKLQASDILLLAAALKQNQTVTHLDLADNEIGDAGVKELASVLATNTEQDSGLSSLNLYNNNIDLEGFEALGIALRTNKRLQDLNLCSNFITTANSPNLFFKALEENETLKKLNLAAVFTINHNSNRIKAFSEALKKNKSLEILVLDYNAIDPEGAKALAEMLEKNETLRELSLGENDMEGRQEDFKACLDPRMANSIGFSGLRALKKALEKNKNLTKLSLDLMGPALFMPDRDIISNRAVEKMFFDLINYELQRNESFLHEKSIKLNSSLPLPLDLTNIVKEYAGLPLIKKEPKPAPTPTSFLDKLKNLWKKLCAFIQKQWQRLKSKFKSQQSQSGTKSTPNSESKPLQTMQSSDASKAAPEASQTNIEKSRVHHTTSSGTKTPFSPK